jgi:hypothetical protein
MLDLKKEVTRRDFLKKVGIVILFVFLAKFLIGFLFDKKKQESLSSVYGVGTYGCKR